MHRISTPQINLKLNKSEAEIKFPETTSSKKIKLSEIWKDNDRN